MKKLVVSVFALGLPILLGSADVQAACGCGNGGTVCETQSCTPWRQATAPCGTGRIPYHPCRPYTYGRCRSYSTYSATPLVASGQLEAQVVQLRQAVLELKKRVTLLERKVP